MRACDLALQSALAVRRLGPRQAATCKQTNKQTKKPRKQENKKTNVHPKAEM
jgi:hypothetical protein